MRKIVTVARPALLSTLMLEEPTWITAGFTSNVKASPFKLVMRGKVVLSIVNSTVPCTSPVTGSTVEVNVGCVLPMIMPPIPLLRVLAE